MFIASYIIYLAGSGTRLSKPQPRCGMFDLFKLFINKRHQELINTILQENLVFFLICNYWAGRSGLGDWPLDLPKPNRNP